MADGFSQTSETITGGLVLAAALGFGLYAAGVVGSSGAGVPYTAAFSSAQGVGVGTDVRLAGVKVGSVTAVSLNPVTYRAEAEFTVDAELDLPEDTLVAVSTEGLLGGTFVELLPGTSPFMLEPGTQIRDTQSAVSVVELLMRAFDSAGSGR